MYTEDTMHLKNSSYPRWMRCPARLGLVTLLAAAALLLPGQVMAQAKVGTTGAQFLELGVSARAMGMADAYIAVVDDISAVYYNPASLTQLYGKEVAFTLIDMPADVSYNFAGFGMPLESVGGVVGVSGYFLSSGDMVVRDYGHAVDGTGELFSWDDYAIALSYGRYLTDRFSIGATVRWIGEYSAGETALGWSADVGTCYDTGHRGFKIAMVITNFGPDLKMIQTAYPLPINFKFGGSINVIEGYDHLLVFSAEGSHPSDNLEKYNAGLEYTFKDRFVLRGGGRFNYDVDGFTAGGGVRWPLGENAEIGIDYAYQDFGILTEVHRFTMMLSF